MLSTINLTVNGQVLSGNSIQIASHLINEINCVFTFEGNDWDEFDEIGAIFHNKQNGIIIEKVLINNAATVPQEVMTKKGDVVVNLCAYSIDPITTHKTLQMTSYKNKIIDVLQKVNTYGANTHAPTSEVWEQDVARLDDRIDKIEHNPSIEKLHNYLYKVTYPVLPNGGDNIDDYAPMGCSSYVANGKLYRNLDWDYDESISFMVNAPNFTGMAFGSLGDINTLPYRVVDGVNKHGIMVSTHIIFNDWEWNGQGTTPLHKLSFVVLSTMESIDDIANLPLDDLCPTPSLAQLGYIAQFIVTDGVTTYAIVPSMVDNTYTYIDITSIPKMTNFRWVDSAQVTRDMVELQDRPTGIERYNLMPCDMADLAFTKAYQTSNRLSEFIGIRDTDKYSSDEELLAIYDEAHELYINRQRNGQTWQTIHSVVYGGDGIEHLYIQEDWDRDYVGFSNYYTKAEVDNAIQQAINEALSN